MKLDSTNTNLMTWDAVLLMLMVIDIVETEIVVTQAVAKEVALVVVQFEIALLNDIGAQ